MDPERSEQVGMFLPALQPLLSYYAQASVERQKMEKRVEAEEKIAEARARAQARRSPIADNISEREDREDEDGGRRHERPPEPAPSSGGPDVFTAAEVAEHYYEAFEVAYEHEDCGFCRDIMDELRALPLADQVAGLKELAELEDAAMTGDEPDVDVLREKFETFDVLPRIAT